jgi:hypothetical protein
MTVAVEANRNGGLDLLRFWRFWYMTTMMYEFVLYILPIVLAMYNEFHLKNGFSTINVYDNSTGQ